MKRNLFVLLQLVALSGCVSVESNYQPKTMEITEPPLNPVVTARVGDAMLRQGRYTEHDAIYLRNTVKVGVLGTYTFAPGYYGKIGEDEKSEFYRPLGGADSGQVIPNALADPFQAIRIHRDGRFCGVTTFGEEACAKNADYERRKHPVASSDSFQQTLIYSGKVGDRINVGYREFSNSLARPTFNNEVEYDLSESNVIGYKGGRIEVIEATNQDIKYKVIQNFNFGHPM